MKMTMKTTSSAHRASLWHTVLSGQLVVMLLGKTLAIANIRVKKEKNAVLLANAEKPISGCDP
jgi:hypothetical protein